MAGTLAGRRAPSPYGYVMSGRHLAHTVVSWVVGQPAWLSAIAVWAMAVCFAVAIMSSLRHGDEVKVQSGRRSAATLAWVLGSFVVANLAAVWLSASSRAIETPDNRMLAEAFLPLVALLVLAARSGLRGAGRPVKAAALAGACVLVCVQALALPGWFTRTRVLNGGDLRAADISHSRFVAWLHAHRGLQPLIGSAPQETYLLTAERVRPGPLLVRLNSDVPIATEQIAALARFVDRHGVAYLVWCAADHYFEVPPQALRGSVTLQTLFSDPQGVVYRLPTDAEASPAR